MNRHPSLWGLGAVLAVSVLSSACTTANTTTAFRETYLTDGKSLSIDAKQRLALTQMRPAMVTDKGVRIERALVTCAEPSPDALSAFAAAAGGNFAGERQDAATSTKIEAAINKSLAEAAASIGLRTQTITILRDSMFRICEGYAIGALDTKQVSRLQRRAQQLMLGLLALEQITGAVRAPTVALGSDSGTDPARELESAVASYEARVAGREKASEALQQAQSEQAENQALMAEQDKLIAAMQADIAAKKPGADAAALKTLTDKKAELEKEDKRLTAKAGDLTTALKERQRDVDAARAMRDTAARRISTRSAATADIDKIARETWQLTPEVAASVSKAAVDIVRAISINSFLAETCLDLMSEIDVLKATAAPQEGKGETLLSQVQGTCLRAMAAMVDNQPDSSDSKTAANTTTTSRTSTPTPSPTPSQTGRNRETTDEVNRILNQRRLPTQ